LNGQTNVFDRRLWKRFWQIARLYWFSDRKGQARGGLAMLLILLFSFTAINVILNFVGRDFMTALAEKNLPDFNRNLLIYLGIFVVATPVSVFYNFVRKLLGINWRLWLTGHFLDKYFRNRAYYRINDDKAIDNPDQRISQDISSFTVTSLGFLSILFFSLVQLVSFIGILWSISITLVLALIAYALIGTAVTLFFGKRLVHLNFQQLRREADLRYGLVHVRDNAESIAFYRGEEREEGQVRQRLREALTNLRFLIGWERNLEFFTKGYEYTILILPIVIMAPMYFAGEIKFGVVTQAESAFIQVLSALSVIVSQFEQLSTFVAGITRLATFSTALDPPETAKSGDAPEIESVEEGRVALEHVTLLTPDRVQTLVRDLSAEAPQGKGLLITGPSGAGKSSLLRAVAGLWNAGEGRIARPPLKTMLFLPQRPYMLLGSLREQLLYPLCDRSVGDEELRAILSRVNLADLPERVGGFDAELDWGHLLSLGEQQRLAFARLLLAKPGYAFLDEATSALDEANEARLYEQMRKEGTTYVSVGHRPSLRAYHTRVLELQGGGNWQLREA
jgi:vitamin B12/bleomycin/antimicrobial peptide transport system ATP-binding/permease protein